MEKERDVRLQVHRLLLPLLIVACDHIPSLQDSRYRGILRFCCAIPLCCHLRLLLGSQLARLQPRNGTPGRRCPPRRVGDRPP